MTVLTSAAMRTMMQFHQEMVLVSVSGIDWVRQDRPNQLCGN
jgi:hypothetical protein